MAIERVREYLKQFNIDHKIQEFETSSATVELAAQALGREPGEIAKTTIYLEDKIPTSIDGLKSAAVNRDTLLSSGYTYKNINTDDQRVVLAIPKSPIFISKLVPKNKFPNFKSL